LGLGPYRRGMSRAARAEARGPPESVVIHRATPDARAQTEGACTRRAVEARPSGTRCVDVRLVLALAEPDSDEALAWVERLISDMEYGDYPHHFNALLVARTAGDSRARQLVETWREAYELPPEDLRWLIGFVSAG
jgi:hypothetical protein